jgi:hypothetical protein
MGIIGFYASEMAEKRRRGSTRRRRAALSAWRPMFLANKGPDNKIERIQSVLRHFLREIAGVGLGKS